VVHTEQAVYIFEFKLNGTAQQALAQIEEQGYATPYLTSGKQVIKVGVEFSQSERNISHWLVASELS
jgi:hypothetical protein